MEGGGVRGGAGQHRQLRDGVQHGEFRSPRRAHGRFYRHGAQPDAQQRRVPHAPADRCQCCPPPRHRRRVQHPVCAAPRIARLLHHRSERPSLPLLRPRLQGHGIPARVRRRQARTGHPPHGHRERRDEKDPGVLRAEPGLHRHQDSPVGHVQIRRGLHRDRLRDEIGRRGHGHRTDPGGEHPEGRADGGSGQPRLPAAYALRHHGGPPPGARRAHRQAPLRHRAGHAREEPERGGDQRHHQDRPLVPAAARKHRADLGPGEGTHGGEPAVRSDAGGEGEGVQRRADLGMPVGRYHGGSGAGQPYRGRDHAGDETDRYAGGGVSGEYELPVHDVQRYRK
mmetsp:Transcript_33962/g.66957  ORF Transcript_33962/g.66957 Transcript_33962/m.66957 type:complete len:339 (+) Transcript_33962:2164-3180(+)